MEIIEHKYIEANGLKHHVAEIGTPASPAVLFLHGFPEIWYTWRHQMAAVAAAGFRAIAPDYRGYGLSDPPPEPEKASFSDFVSDMAAILDALGIIKIAFGLSVKNQGNPLYNNKRNSDLVPSILTLALNDAVTYDKVTIIGVPNGSICFNSEISRPQNKGFSEADRDNTSPSTKELHFVKANN